MDCVLAGGTFTRTEGKRAVTYKRGDPIKVSKEEFAAYPNKFSQLVPAQDDTREKQLEGEVKNLQGEVKTLKGDVKFLQDEKAELERQLTGVQGELKLKTNPGGKGSDK